MTNSASGVTLENFDDVWGQLGDPVAVEAMLAELLPLAEKALDQSIYPQILSQIALAQGMQKKFRDAHATLVMRGQVWTIDI